MRVIFLGLPGAGKGTQSVRIAKLYGVPHIATGDLLRYAVVWQYPIGMRAKSYMDAGELVPDEIVLELLKARLAQADARQGFVMDGFPRTLEQAEALDKILAEIGQRVDVVVFFEVPDELIVLRLSARASCPTCGRTYNMLASPPRVDNICDIEGQPLFQREDDRPEVIAHRLEVFRRQTMPLIAYYEERGLLRRVDAADDEDEVTRRVAGAMDSVLGSGS